MELKTFLKRLLKIVDIEKKKYIVNQIKCFSFLMIYTIASVIFPSFLSKIVDLGVVMGDVSNIVLYTTEMLICGILMVIFYYLQKVFFFKFGNDIVLRTKQKLYKKLNTVDIQFWNQYKVGDVLTILDNDIEKLQELLTSDISELVVNICLCIGISSYIIILNPKIGILVVVMSIIFAFIQRKVANKSKERMKKLRVTMGDFNSFSTETINNMPSLQMTGKTQYIKKMYADKCDELAKEGLDFTKTMCTVGMTGMSFNVLAIVIVLILGAVDVSNNLISVGLLFSMTIYVQRLYSPIVSIGNMFVKIKNFFPLLDNIYNVMFNEKNIIKGDYKHSSELIRDNICMYKNIDDKTIMEACKDSGLADFISEVSLDYVVGQNGAMLSEGQKQKIALARALVHNSPVIIFDEATSNTDVYSEHQINGLLHTKLKEKTVIIITHKQEILKEADQIIMLKDGAVVGSGVYDDLSKDNLEFKNMLKMGENIE